MPTPRKNNPKWLVIHHTAVDISVRRVQFDMVNIDHKNRWPDFPSSLGFYVGYHYFIEPDGVIKQARPTEEEGAQCIGKNTESIGICLAGNFSLFGRKPTSEQEAALRKLLPALMKKHNIPVSNVVPHRFFRPTECYGKNLSAGWISTLVVPEIEKDEELDIEKKRELIKTKISIIQKLLAVLVKLQALLFNNKNMTAEREPLGQIKYSFDNVTLVKIGKGALIAGAGAVALYLLAILRVIEIGNPILTSFLAWFIPVATNSIKEWVKGETGKNIEVSGEEATPSE